MSVSLQRANNLIVQRDNSTLNPEIVNPAIIRDIAPVSGLGTVSEISGGFIVNQTFEDTISFSFTNTLLVAQTLMLFDPTGIVENQNGLTTAPPTLSNIATTPVIWNAYLLTRQYLFKGFNYNVTNATQLANDIKVSTASASGLSVRRLTPSSFQRNTAQNPNLLTFSGNILVTPSTGIFVTVPAGESVSFDFYGGTLFDGFASIQG